MDSPSEWVRATFLSAVTAGVYWAVALRITAVSSSAPSWNVGVAAVLLVSVVPVVIGLMLYRRGGNSQLKTAGVALVLAPASGTAALLTIALLSVVR